MKHNSFISIINLFEWVERSIKAGQILNENNIYKGNGYSISVDNDRGGRFSYTPYFKFCKGNKYNKSEKIARIPIKQDMSKPYNGIQYQIHNNGVGKHFNLNSKEFDILDEMLRKDLGGYTVWDEIIRVSNQYILMHDRKDLLIDLDTPIPDYRNLLQEV